MGSRGEWTRDYVPRRSDDAAFDAFRRSGDTEDWFNIGRAVVLFPLAIVRFTSAMVFVLICYLAFLLFGPVLERDQRSRPSTWPPWRRSIVDKTGKICARCALFCFGFHSIKRTELPGYNADEAKRATIIANHISMVDILLMMANFMPAIVAKDAVQKLPFIGRIAEGMQCVFVDRLSTKRGNTTEAIVERQHAVARGEAVPQVLLFPEGTTSNGKFLLPFKTGSFVGGEPVLPVIIRYPYKRFSPAYDSIRAGHFLPLLLTQFYNRLEFDLCPVYYPSDEEKKNPDVYSKNVRLYMAKVGGFQLSNSLFIDKLEYQAVFRGDPLPLKPKAA